MINIKELLNLTYYTSKIDEFLAEFDKKYPKLSASQRKEKEKYARIFALRDLPEKAENKQTFWDQF